MEREGAHRSAVQYQAAEEPRQHLDDDGEGDSIVHAIARLICGHGRRRGESAIRNAPRAYSGSACNPFVLPGLHDEHGFRGPVITHFVTSANSISTNSS